MENDVMALAVMFVMSLVVILVVGVMVVVVLMVFMVVMLVERGGCTAFCAIILLKNVC